MRHYIRTGLLLCFMLTLGWHKAHAAGVGLQPSAASVRPLYTVTSGYDKEQQRIGHYTVPNYTTKRIAVRPTGSMQHAHVYGINAWRGNISEVGASAPVSEAMTTTNAELVVRREVGGGSGGFPYNPGATPIGDTPYWLVAVLLGGYCLWRKRRRIDN